jgi:hypothetical protein
LAGHKAETNGQQGTAAEIAIAKMNRTHGVSPHYEAQGIDANDSLALARDGQKTP